MTSEAAAQAAVDEVDARFGDKLDAACRDPEFLAEYNRLIAMGNGPRMAAMHAERAMARRDAYIGKLESEIEHAEMEERAAAASHAVAERAHRARVEQARKEQAAAEMRRMVEHEMAARVTYPTLVDRWLFEREVLKTIAPSAPVVKKGDEPRSVIEHPIIRKAQRRMTEGMRSALLGHGPHAERARVLITDQPNVWGEAARAGRVPPDKFDLDGSRARAEARFEDDLRIEPALNPPELDRCDAWHIRESRQGGFEVYAANGGPFMHIPTRPLARAVFEFLSGYCLDEAVRLRAEVNAKLPKAP